MNYEIVLIIEEKNTDIVILADGNNGFKYYLESLDGYPLSPVYSTASADIASTIEQAKILAKQF